MYDSYLSKNWQSALHNNAGPYVIALMTEKVHMQEILHGGFDGIYTYFASDGFVYGSSTSTWASTSSFCKEHHLIFIPSVGPGYNDEKIRPWNAKNTKKRENGEYYKRMFRAAIQVKPAIISITSFNEWHEGTQIESSSPHLDYPDFSPLSPSSYLDMTKELATEYFESQK